MKKENENLRESKLTCNINLYKIKIFSFKPGRFCLKIIGEPSFILTNIANINRMGLRMIKAINDKIKSISLLKKCLYII